MAATWADSGSTSTKMGVTGYVFSGGSVYDHRSGDDDDAPLAIYWEGDSLDPYNGHSDADSQYHYHAVSFTSLYTVILNGRWPNINHRFIEIK